jgi:hypothetical protein
MYISSQVKYFDKHLKMLNRTSIFLYLRGKRVMTPKLDPFLVIIIILN